MKLQQTPTERKMKHMTDNRNGGMMAQRIFDQLKQAIENGEYAPGARIPSEKDICISYGVRRSIARIALDQLVHRGLAFRGADYGRYVSDEHDRFALTSDPSQTGEPMIALMFRKQKDG